MSEEGLRRMPDQPVTADADRVERLRSMADALKEQAERIIAEVDGVESYGARYQVVRAYVIGSKTDDPGLIIKVRSVR